MERGQYLLQLKEQNVNTIPYMLVASERPIEFQVAYGFFDHHPLNPGVGSLKTKAHDGFLRNRFFAGSHVKER
jgi:hypothetical protein